MNHFVYNTYLYGIFHEYVRYKDRTPLLICDTCNVIFKNIGVDNASEYVYQIYCKLGSYLIIKV